MSRLQVREGRSRGAWTVRGVSAVRHGWGPVLARAGTRDGRANRIVDPSPTYWATAEPGTGITPEPASSKRAPSLPDVGRTATAYARRRDEHRRPTAPYHRRRRVSVCPTCERLSRGTALRSRCRTHLIGCRTKTPNSSDSHIGTAFPSHEAAAVLGISARSSANTLEG